MECYDYHSLARRKSQVGRSAMVITNQPEGEVKRAAVP